MGAAVSAPYVTGARCQGKSLLGLLWLHNYLLAMAPDGIPEKGIAIGIGLELIGWKPDGSVTTINHKPTEIWYDENVREKDDAERL
jgi:hypothetical protein